MPIAKPTEAGRRAGKTEPPAPGNAILGAAQRGLLRWRWWLLAGLAALLLGTETLLPGRVRVIVYNDGARPFSSVDVKVGDEDRVAGALPENESICLAFAAPAHSEDLRVRLGGRPDLLWSAPALVSPPVSTVILHVDAGGGFSYAAETTLADQLRHLLH